MDNLIPPMAPAYSSSLEREMIQPGPARRGLAFAIAGLVLAFVFAPLGLIVSIIGLVRSRGSNRTARVLSSIGIVASLIELAVIIVFVIAALNATHSSASGPAPTVVDPACNSAADDFSSMLAPVTFDNAALSHDARHPSAQRADVRQFITDAQALQTELTREQAQAHYQSVKVKLAAMSSDLAGVTSSLQAAEHGDSSRLGQVNAALSRLDTDAAALDSICLPGV